MDYRLPLFSQQKAVSSRTFQTPEPQQPSFSNISRDTDFSSSVSRGPLEHGQRLNHSYQPPSRSCHIAQQSELPGPLPCPASLSVYCKPDHNRIQVQSKATLQLLDYPISLDPVDETNVYVSLPSTPSIKQSDAPENALIFDLTAKVFCNGPQGRQEVLCCSRCNLRENRKHEYNYGSPIDFASQKWIKMENGEFSLKFRTVCYCGDHKASFFWIQFILTERVAGSHYLVAEGLSNRIIIKDDHKKQTKYKPAPSSSSSDSTNSPADPSIEQSRTSATHSRISDLAEHTSKCLQATLPSTSAGDTWEGLSVLSRIPRQIPGEIPSVGASNALQVDPQHNAWVNALYEGAAISWKRESFGPSTMPTNMLPYPSQANRTRLQSHYHHASRVNIPSQSMQMPSSDKIHCDPPNGRTSSDVCPTKTPVDLASNYPHLCNPPQISLSAISVPVGGDMEFPKNSKSPLAIRPNNPYQPLPPSARQQRHHNYTHQGNSRVGNPRATEKYATRCNSNVSRSYQPLQHANATLNSYGPVLSRTSSVPMHQHVPDLSICAAESLEPQFGRDHNFEGYWKG